MAHDSRQGHRRAERIAEDRHGQAGFGQALGHMAEIILAESLPIAAVDIDMKPRRRLLRQEEIEAGGRMLAISDVEIRLGRGAEGRTTLLPGLEKPGGLRQAPAGVVLEAQLVGRHVPEYRFVHRPCPLARSRPH
jgi:hypothetical protein